MQANKMGYHLLETIFNHKIAQALPVDYTTGSACFHIRRLLTAYKYAVLDISKPYLAHHGNLSSRQLICSKSSI